MPSLTVTSSPRLFTVIATGTLSRDDILGVIAEHYRHLDTDRLLWRLDGADVSSLTKQDLHDIAVTAKMLLPENPERKTAYVVPDARAYVFLHQYINEAVFLRVRSEYAAFREVEPALEWLGVPAAADSQTGGTSATEQTFVADGGSEPGRALA